MKDDTVNLTQPAARSPEAGPVAGASDYSSPVGVPATPRPEQGAFGGGAYEGAAQFSRELANWHVRNGSADLDILPKKDLLDARSKDVARNDAYVENGIEKLKDSVVGAKFTLNANPNLEYLKRIDKRFDEKWLEEFQEEQEAEWELYAESNSRWVDAARKKTATEIIRLGLASILLQGENLISSEWVRRQRRPYRTAFLMIDPTRLDDPGVTTDAATVKNNIRKGVRLNAYGEAVGYFIANDHPHDYYPMFRSDFTGRSFQYTPKETPWGRMNIFHGYEERRVGQTRGIAKMVSALKEMKMTKSFRDVMLQNAIVNATYAATIESELPTQSVLEMLGGSDATSPEEFGTAINGYTGGFLASLAQYLAESNGTTLNGVKIPHLFPGTKLNMLKAAQGGPLGTEFETSLLRYLSANMGMSYEQFTGDMSNVNYSTLRGAINETEKRMKVSKRVDAERIANFMYCNWTEERFVEGSIVSMPKNPPPFWEGMNREAYSQADWMNSGRGQVEELKETQAASLRLKAKISTREEEMGRFGKDWRRQIRQMGRERDYAKKFEIDLEFDDNALNAASGQPREKDASDDDGEKPIKKDKSKPRAR